MWVSESGELLGWVSPALISAQAGLSAYLPKVRIILSDVCWVSLPSNIHIIVAVDNYHT